MLDPGYPETSGLKYTEQFTSDCLHIKISHQQYDPWTGDAKPPLLPMTPLIIHTRNKAGDFLTATGAPQPGCVWALRSHVSIYRKNLAAESCLTKVQQWKMLRCIAIWRKNSWRKKQALFFHTTEVYKSLSLDPAYSCKLALDIIWVQGQSAFGHTWNSAV